MNKKGRFEMSENKSGIVYFDVDCCTCENVMCGTHEVNISIDVSQYSCFDEYVKNRVKAGLSDGISADRCIVEPMRKLWEKGIMTYNSCCGHQKHRPHALIGFENIDKAKEHGFDVEVYEHGNHYEPILEDYEKKVGLYYKYTVRKRDGDKPVSSDCVVLKFDDPLATAALTHWAHEMGKAGYLQVESDVLNKLDELGMLSKNKMKGK